MTGCLLVVGPSSVGRTRMCREISADTGAHFLNADPGKQEPTPLACVSLWASEKDLVEYRFVGGHSLTSDPIRSLSAIASCALRSPCVVELPIEAITPVSTHLRRAIRDVLKPERVILVGMDEVPGFEGLPIELREPHPEAAGRKGRITEEWRAACWTSLFSEARRQALSLGSVRFEGARLGSGVVLEEEDLIALGGSVLYGEVQRSTAYLIVRHGFTDEDAVAAANLVGCDRAHLTTADRFDGVICCLQGSRGENLGVGRITAFDADQKFIETLTSAPDGSSPEVVQVGTLRFDDEGEPVGRLRAWQV